MELAFIFGGLAAVVATLWAHRRALDLRRPVARVFAVTVLHLTRVLALLALAFGAYRFALNHRPLPNNVNEPLFDGIRYDREVRRSKRTQIIHVVTVDLRAPGLGFLVTPGDPHADMPLRARTTSQFLTEFKVQLAVNGDMFTPWVYEPFRYYPHVGDPVTPAGTAASRGVAYGKADPSRPTLFLSADNQASFGAPIGPLYNAVSGNCMFVAAGALAIDHACHAVAPWIRHPRTAVALDRDARTLLIVVIDGRQSGYSDGATLEELGEIVIAHGGFTALNLDGGGSTELVREDHGAAHIMNSPIHHPLFGPERPIGNHLGIFARQNGVTSSP